LTRAFALRESLAGPDDLETRQVSLRARPVRPPATKCCVAEPDRRIIISRSIAVVAVVVWERSFDVQT
jgi:hypothetical protein